MLLKARVIYLALVIATIALGLLSRSDSLTLPTFLATYAGDTIWALMVYWGFRMLLPAQSIFIAAILAVLFAFAIEILQLVQIPWIDAIRYTKIGGLILGYGFKFSDLVCYSVGVAIGAFADYLFHRQHVKRG